MVVGIGSISLATSGGILTSFLEWRISVTTQMTIVIRVAKIMVRICLLVMVILQSMPCR